MTENHFFTQQIEAKVGAMTCIFDADFNFNYYSRSATAVTPAEDELTVIKATAAEDQSFYVDDEELSTASAHKYYKIFKLECYEQQLPDKLSEFLDQAAEEQADQICEEWLQKQY